MFFKINSFAELSYLRSAVSKTGQMDFGLRWHGGLSQNDYDERILALTIALFAEFGVDIISDNKKVTDYIHTLQQKQFSGFYGQDTED